MKTVGRSHILVLTGLLFAGGYVAYRAVILAGGDDAAGGEQLVSVVVPKLVGEEQAGEAAFQKNCAACHGANAAGRNGYGPPLVHEIYEPNHHSDQAFYLAAARGVRSHHWPFGNMPPVEGIGEAEVKSIVAYVRAMQRANGIN